jgi:hypothetical protein
MEEGHRYWLASHFDSTNALSVLSAGWGDMYVQTAERPNIGSTPYRVFGLSGNPAHDGMFNYFQALASAYGRPMQELPTERRKTLIPAKIQFKAAVLNLGADDPRSRIRLIESPEYFGIQTFTDHGGEDEDWAEDDIRKTLCGPVVWIPTDLAGLKLEVRNLRRFIEKQDLQPYTPGAEQGR